MIALNKRQRKSLEILRRAINNAIMESDVVGHALAAMVEEGVRVPVSIEVNLLTPISTRPMRGAERIENATAANISRAPLSIQLACVLWGSAVIQSVSPALDPTASPHVVFLQSTDVPVPFAERLSRLPGEPPKIWGGVGRPQ